MKEELASILAWHKEMKRPVVKCLRPGASKATLDKLESQHDLLLPMSLRELLGWRDGTSMKAGRTLDDLSFLPSFHLLSARSGFLERSGGDGSPGWDPNEYPFLSNGGGDTYTVTYVSPRAADARVAVKRFDSFEYEPVYASLKSMIDTVERCFSEGAYRVEGGRLVEDLALAAALALEGGHSVDYWGPRARTRPGPAVKKGPARQAKRRS